MVIWIAFAVAWLWFFYTVRNGNLRSMLPAYFATAGLALGLDVLLDVILGLHSYQVPGLTNEWAILVLGWLGYPVVGSLFMRYLPGNDTFRAAYAVIWSGVLFGVEALALRSNELVHTEGWQIWWSPFVYLGAMILLLIVISPSARPGRFGATG